jgi:autophagy-related protein 9
MAGEEIVNLFKNCHKTPMMENRDLWNDAYAYYLSKGLRMFVLDNIVSILIGFAISLTPILIFTLSDFTRLRTAKSLSDLYIPFSFDPTPITISLFIISSVFALFNLLQLVQFLCALPHYLRLHNYFTSTLHITDTELAVLDWREVIDSIQLHESTERKPILTITQEILKMDNFICALISDPSILMWRLPFCQQSQQIPMTRFFFYLFKLTLSGVVLDSNGGSLVSGVQGIRSGNAIRQLQMRSRLIGFGLAILSPFVLAFEMLYLVFHYSQAIRESPKSLSLRRWTPQATWLIREYNELPHILNARIAKSYEPANCYVDLFPSAIVQPILRMIAFFSGAILTILFIVGLITDSSYLLTVEVMNGKSLAWLISILASIYGICKVSIVADVRPFSAEECMVEIERYTHFDFRDGKNSAHSWEAFNKFTSLFQPMFFQLALELMSVVLNPLLFIVVIPMKAQSIVGFVKQHSVNVQDLGWICEFSVFDQEQANRSRPAEQKKKYLRSVSSFNRLHGLESPLIEVEDELEDSMLGLSPVQQEEQLLEESLVEIPDIIGPDGDPFYL